MPFQTCEEALVAYYDSRRGGAPVVFYEAREVDTYPGLGGDRLQFELAIIGAVLGEFSELAQALIRVGYDPAFWYCGERAPWEQVRGELPVLRRYCDWSGALNAIGRLHLRDVLKRRLGKRRIIRRADILN